MQIALTFDTEHPDRPHCPPGVVDRIIAELDRASVPATFFLQGRWVEAYPHIARDIARAGHRVGNHSYYHARLALLSDQGIAADIAAADNVIRTVTQKDPRPWFRCPWGECGGEARVQRVLGAEGYRHIGWHIEGGDWQVGYTPREVEAAIVDGALAIGPAAIVLLHAWPTSVPAALPGMIRRLRAARAEFVTLDALHPSAFQRYQVPAVGTTAQERVV